MSSASLTSVIKNEIQKSNGFISFSKFMEISLYDPHDGYYMAEREIFGKSGDFVTAPMISPLFSECLARQCHEILTNFDQGCIVEIGAGSGIFTKDLLLSLEKLNALPKTYFIYEISNFLREKQRVFLQTHCKHLLSKVVWLNHLEDVDCDGIIIANEVLDAMPVHCFSVIENEIYEKGVTYNNDGFAWTHRVTENNTFNTKIKFLKNTYNLPSNYISEMNLFIQPWINKLATLLKRGIILLMDYGYHQSEYYHPDRNQGTLMCYTKHQCHDNPFINIGYQDITAHVNFTAVLESAVLENLSLQGYTTQSGFLLALGIMELAQQNLTALDQYQSAQAIKKLILPGEMGEIIKVMALGKNLDLPMKGFSLVDRRKNL